MDVKWVRMNDFYSIFHGRTGKQGRDDDNRLLRKLRLALLFWLITMIITIIWFTNSPAF